MGNVVNNTLNFPRSKNKLNETFLDKFCLENIVQTLRESSGNLKTSGNHLLFNFLKDALKAVHQLFGQSWCFDVIIKKIVTGS